MTHKSTFDGHGAGAQRFGRLRANRGANALAHNTNHGIATKLASIFLSAILVLTMMPATVLAHTASDTSDTQATAQSADSPNATPGTDTSALSSAGEGDASGATNSASNVDESDCAAVDDPTVGTMANPAPQSADELSATCASFTAAAASLELEVAYPEQIKCNTPITFTLTPKNGSGPIGSRLDWVNGNGEEFKDHARYEYNMNMADLWQMNPDTGNYAYMYDVDCTRFKYQEENTFTYTFAVPGSYKFRFYVQDYGLTQLQMARAEVFVEVTDPTAPSLDEIVASMASNAQVYATQYDKALYVHDQIIENASYDHDLLNAGPTGVLVRGKGTCESFHRAFALVLRKLGIECYRATGNGHVWSCVKLDGEWAQIDVTWDAGEHKGDIAYQDHLYFGVTDEMIKLVHNEHAPVASRPCTSFDRNYFIRSGEIAKWSDSVKEEIETNIKDGQTSFNVLATYDSYPGVYRIIYPLAAYALNKSGLTVDGKRVTVEFVRVGNNDAGSLQDSYFKVTASLDCAHTFTAWQRSGSNLLVDARQTRSCTACGETQTSTLKAQMPQYASYASVFDPMFYAGNYSDIKAAFGTNEQAMFWHFINYGITEGRRGIASFDVASYYNANPDLRRAFGTNVRAITMHYVSYGKREGRTCLNAPQLQGFTSTYAGTNWSPVYDGKYYHDTYADLRSAFTVRAAANVTLFDDAALLRHFVNNGMAEGRKATASFDVASYYNANPDLRAAFGTNVRAITMHYVSYGKREGRTCLNVPQLQGFVSSYAGTNWSPVYDGKYYHDTYADLRSAFTVRAAANVTLFDDQALLRHFVDWGMAEGRQGRASFNVNVYRSSYPDLRAAFGSNLRAYYMHYVNYGQREGRKAA